VPRALATALLLWSSGCCYSEVGETQGGGMGSAGSATAGTLGGQTMGPGTSATGATGGSTGNGSTTGGDCPTAYAACFSQAACGCGELCVQNLASFHPYSEFFCAPTCEGDLDCPNVLTECMGGLLTDGGTAPGVCVVVPCATPEALPGSRCAARGSRDGTCVPMFASQLPASPSVLATLACVPNGTATACVEGTNSDDPFYGLTSAPAELLPELQPFDAASFCGPGEACYAPLGVAGAPGLCAQLCPVPADAGPDVCAPPNVCVQQAGPYTEVSFGFCLPCVPSNSDGGDPGLCIADSDCCEGSCGPRIYGTGQIALYGLCQPAD